MLACRIHAKDDLRVEETAMPDAGPGEVLLKLGAGGICGSDLHYYFEGRNGSFVVRDRKVIGELECAATLPFGLGGGPPVVSTCDLEPSDHVLLYTDGVTETLNAEGDEFGLDRVMQSVRASATNGAQAIVRKIIEDVRDFTGSLPQNDDITLVAIRKV